MPLLSIIIPVYNTPERLLLRCVESVLKQSFVDFEILLIDDGSQGNIPQIMDKLALQDKRIRVFHQQNNGVSSARNLGIEKCLGDYVMFIDSDDVITPQALTEGSEVAKKHNADIVIGLTKSLSNEVWEHTVISENAGQFVVEVVDEPQSYQKLISQILTIDNFWFQYKDGYLSSGPVAKLYRNEIVKQVSFHEQIKVGEDTIWLLEILAKSKRVYIVDRLWYYYISNADSATHKFRYDRIREFLCEIEEYNRVINAFWPQNLPDFYMRLYVPLKSVFEQYLFHPDNKDAIKKKYSDFKTILDAPVMHTMIQAVDFTRHEKTMKNIVKQVALKSFLLSKPLSFGINTILFTMIRRG